MAFSPVIARGQPRGHKRTDLLVAVLVTLLGAAVLAIAMLAATIQKRDETIKELRAKSQGSAGGGSRPLIFYASHGGNLPIVTASRRSLSGTGFVLTIRSECTEELPLVLALENQAGNRRKTANIVAEPLQTTEFSHFDDWKLSAGDVVQISHEGFNSVSMRF